MKCNALKSNGKMKATEVGIKVFDKVQRYMQTPMRVSDRGLYRHGEP